MLILTRRIDETLVIGDEVKITVLGVKGNQVRIGVEAPKDVTVHREEVYEKIQDNDTASGQHHELDNDDTEPSNPQSIEKF